MADYVVETEGNKDEYAWPRYIHNRLHNQNKNFIALCQGPTGSGKTFTMISVCKMVDPSFDESRIVFSAKDLMLLINSGTLKKGSCILFDEAQISLSSRNWYSVVNKMLNYLLSTFRHRNFCLMMTAPYADFVDSQSKRLFHAEFKTTAINRKDNTCIVKPHLLQYNPSMKKYYRHRLKILKKLAGKTKTKAIRITTWAVPKPDDELINAFETKKNEFTTKLNIGIMKQLDKIEKTEGGDDKDADKGAEGKKLTDRQQEAWDLWVKYMKEGKGKVYASEMAAKEYGSEPRTFYRQLEAVKHKGYDLKSHLNAPI